jgi:hypothetical protein
MAAVGAQHRRLALPDPTSHSLLILARRGFAVADARRRTGAPLCSAAYPAAAALSCLGYALRSGSSADLRYWGVVCLGFLLSARPRASSSSPQMLSVWHRMRYIPSSACSSTARPDSRRAWLFRIPTADESDSIRFLFRRLLAAFQGRPHAQWFV